MRRALWCAAVTAVVAVPAAGDGAGPNTFDEAAETGQRPPGTPAGVTYSAIQTPMTDGTGKFLFESELEGASLGSGFEDAGVFLGKRGAAQLVARVAQVAPGTGGLQWSKLLGVGQIVRPTGRVAFPGELAGADPSKKGGIWAGTVGNLQLVAREGDPAPGTTVNFAAGNRYFQDGVHLAMNDAGTVALRAKLSGTGVTTANDQAIFVGPPGALSLVGRIGSPAPDAGGATFAKASTESFTSPSINASGQILFRGHLAGPAVTATNGDAIWFGDPAAPTIAARGGQVVTGPDIAPNAYLIGLGAEPPVLNDAGQILFESPYYDGVNLVQCVWLGGAQTPTAIAMKGRTVAGDSKGATLSGSYLHLRLNGAGQAAFHATLSSGASDSALLVWDGAMLREVARTGDPAPGMPIGETFDAVATEDVFLNGSGKVLFRATTAPSQIVGVWLWDPAAGAARLIARTGDDVKIGILTKLLIDIELYSGPDTAGSPQDGRSSPFGDDGTYAISGQTVDGHISLLTNAGGAVSAGTTTTSLSVGAGFVVTGFGFGGGATKFTPPTAWLTLDGDPKKIPLRVDRKTASNNEIHATLASLRKGAHGAATLHVLPRVKGAAEATVAVTIELPSLTGLSAADLRGGEILTLTGAYFGAKKRLVRFNATVNGKAKTWKLAVKTWADGSITAVVPKRAVPKGAPTLAGAIVVTNDAGDSPTAIAFTIDA
jgi:hypothetical protein